MAREPMRATIVRLEDKLKQAKSANAEILEQLLEAERKLESAGHDKDSALFQFEIAVRRAEHYEKLYKAAALLLEQKMLEGKRLDYFPSFKNEGEE